MYMVVYCISDVFPFLLSLYTFPFFSRSLKCLFPSYTEADVFYSILVVWALIPIILSLAWLLFWHLVKIFRSHRVANIAQKRHTSIVAVLYLIWPSLCSQTFSAFACRSVCDLDTSFLRASIDEPCFQGRHVWYVILVALPMMLGYILGFPLVAYLAIRKLQQRALRKNVDRSTLKGHQTWGAFYSSFRPETWWWEGTVALRKIVIAMVGVFGSSMGPMQVQLTLMLVMLVIVLTATIRPFSNEAQQEYLLQGLELSSLMAIFLTLWAALTFSTYPKCEDPLNAGKTIFWCDALSVTVGIVNFIIFFGLIACFVAVKLFGVNFTTVVAESKAGKTLSRWSQKRSFRKEQSSNIRHGGGQPSEGHKEKNITDAAMVSAEAAREIELTATASKTTTATNDSASTAASAADCWKSQVDPATSKACLYNSKTRETKWVEDEVKKEEDVTIDQPAAIHSYVNPLVGSDDNGGWQYLYDESASAYYWYNPTTNQSKWAK